MIKMIAYIVMIIFLLFSNLISKSNKVATLDDYLTREAIFLIPDLGTTQSYQIRSRYSNKQLFFVNNQLTFENDSISFDLFTSMSNKKFDKTHLIFPDLNYSKNTFIYDLIKFNNEFIFLIDKALLVFTSQDNSIKFQKVIPIEQNCVDIIKIKSNNIFLTSQAFVKNKFSNFVLKLDLINDKSSLISFDDTKNNKLVNIGPRHNKAFIDDTTVIYSDILNYKLFFESKSEKKTFQNNMTDWNSVDSAMCSYKKNRENLKTELLNKRKIIDTSSSIFNVFALGNYLFIQYAIHDIHKDLFIDIYKIDRANKNLLLIAQQLNAVENKKDTTFSIEDMGLSIKLKPEQEYLLELTKYPFSDEKIFKSYKDFEEERDNQILNGGALYSIIVRRVK